jgi:hypothetical protein
VIPARASGHLLLLSGRHPGRRQAETPLIPLCKFPEPALSSALNTDIAKFINNGFAVTVVNGIRKLWDIKSKKSKRQIISLHRVIHEMKSERRHGALVVGDLRGSDCVGPALNQATVLAAPLR